MSRTHFARRRLAARKRATTRVLLPLSISERGQPSLCVSRPPQAAAQGANDDESLTPFIDQRAELLSIAPREEGPHGTHLAPDRGRADSCKGEEATPLGRYVEFFGERAKEVRQRPVPTPTHPPLDLQEPPHESLKWPGFKPNSGTPEPS